MKKNKWYIVASLMAVVIVAIYLTSDIYSSKEKIEASNMEIIRMEADHIVFENLKELENKADIIVVAKSTGINENIVNVVQGDIPRTYGHTKTEIEVLEFIKKPADLELAINETFKIIEPYYVVDTNDGTEKNIRTWGEYSIVQDDAYYIFYLGWDKANDGYAIEGIFQGKFNIDGKDKQEGKHPRPDLKNAVLEKFSEKIKNIVN